VSLIHLFDGLRNGMQVSDFFLHEVMSGWMASFFCFSCVRALAFRVEGRIGWGWIFAVQGFVVRVYVLKRCVLDEWCEKKELELHERSELNFIYQQQPTYIILFSCLSVCFCERSGGGCCIPACSPTSVYFDTSVDRACLALRRDIMSCEMENEVDELMAKSGRKEEYCV